MLGNLGAAVIGSAKRATGRAGLIAMAAANGPTRKAAMGVIRSGSRSMMRPAMIGLGAGAAIGGIGGAIGAGRRGDSMAGGFLGGAFRGAMFGGFVGGFGSGLARLGSPASRMLNVMPRRWDRQLGSASGWRGAHAMRFGRWAGVPGRSSRITASANEIPI